MRIKGFTMIETIIVLAIISFLFGVTMYYGSQRVNKLNDINFKQNFVQKYQEIYMNSISSSYMRGKKYDNLNIDFDKTGLYFSIDSGTKTKLFDMYKFYFTGMVTFDTKSLSGFRIKFFPYKIQCSLSYNFSSNTLEFSGITFMLRSQNTPSTRCFKISNYNCKITETACQ